MSYVAKWDFGGFPAWLLTKEPALKLRSSDPTYLALVHILLLHFLIVVSINDLLIIRDVAGR